MPSDPSQGKEPLMNAQGWLKKFIRFIAREILFTFLPALVMAFLLTHYVGEIVVVYSQSMEPNLHEEQQIIVEKLSGYFQIPRRGDIVILHVAGEETPLIKRVIGLPGEELEIKNNQVFINGQGLVEPYLASSTQGDFGPVHVSQDHVFVMGDNRNNSRDSRVIGSIALKQVEAKAWISIWPIEEIQVFHSGRNP